MGGGRRKTTVAWPVERRQNLRLRSLFGTIFAMVEPFFHVETGWGNAPLEHLVLRVVRSNFPELTSGELRCVFHAVQRAYAESRPELGDRPRPLTVFE